MLWYQLDRIGGMCNLFSKEHLHMIILKPSRSTSVKLKCYTNCVFYVTLQDNNYGNNFAVFSAVIHTMLHFYNEIPCKRYLILLYEHHNA